MNIRYTQNFLKSEKLVEQIVKLGDIQPDSTILEIGPGEGIITRELARYGQVVAVELDAKLAKKLILPGVKVINMDILQYDLAELPAGYIVFSNVPFNITSELLEHLLNAQTGCQQAHLILQEDAIKPDAQTETFKSMMIYPLYTIDVAHRFKRSDFSPQPGVDTALFAFKRREQPLIDAAQYETYKDFLAFISKDRVGEGVWKKLFSKNQLERMPQLISARGLKSQSAEGIFQAFETFMKLNTSKLGLIQGTMNRLREEQKRRERINQAGGHHRSQKR